MILVLVYYIAIYVENFNLIGKLSDVLIVVNHNSAEGSNNKKY